jgi:hypothetical protein
MRSAPAFDEGARIRDLEEAVQRLEEERDLLLRRRRRNLLIVGVSLSIIAHVGLMLTLNLLRRAGPAQDRTVPVAFEIAVLHDPRLTTLADLDLERIMPEVPAEDDPQPNDPSASLEPDASAATLDVSASGSVPTLGGAGSGSGEGSTLGGSGAGASFFGVSSRGTRFAYIVDVSGSMGSGREARKIDTAMKELARSVQGLPDYAHFFVVLYSTAPRSFHENWTRARPNVLSTLVRWLNATDPGGGTQPAPAFDVVFGLRERPDVVFFLTDGLIPAGTPAYVADFNRHGRRVVINTIAFGDPTSQEMLKEIARASGGQYRFIPE